MLFEVDIHNLLYTFLCVKNKIVIITSINKSKFDSNNMNYIIFFISM